MTAEPTSVTGSPSRPKTTRRPSRRRTATTHRAAAGHSVPCRARSASVTKVSDRFPLASSGVSSAALNACRGRRASSSTVARSRSRRPRAGDRRTPGGGPTGPRRRTDAATIAPAEVPTTTTAVRGSRPASSIARSTPRWNASPAVPPAPSTSPSRSRRSGPSSLIRLLPVAAHSGGGRGALPSPIMPTLSRTVQRARPGGADSAP